MDATLPRLHHDEPSPGDEAYSAPTRVGAFDSAHVQTMMSLAAAGATRTPSMRPGAYSSVVLREKVSDRSSRVRAPKPKIVLANVPRSIPTPTDFATPISACDQAPRPPERLTTTKLAIAFAFALVAIGIPFVVLVQ